VSIPSLEPRLPGVFAELIGAITDGEHLGDALELLTRRSVELLWLSSAGIIVADPRGGFRVVAASDESADVVELFQTFQGEGPALDVLTTGEALTVDITSADRRWPAFAPAARAAGVGWVHAMPIRLDSVVIGALNLFRSEPGGDIPDQALGEALCGLVSIALAQERPARRTERLVERIQQILNERGRIEQVKGILAAHMDASPKQGYTVLAHHARSRGITVVQAAGEVIGEEADPVALIDGWRQQGAPTDEAP
jgi:GAF domain-containing protein